MLYNGLMNFLKELEKAQDRLDQIEAAREHYLKVRADLVVSARNDGANVAQIAKITGLSQVRVYQILQGR